MNIQTETAIVPFQGVIQPARSVDYRIIRYSEAEKFGGNESASSDYTSGQAGTVYDRYGKTSANGYSLGKNVDIYI